MAPSTDAKVPVVRTGLALKSFRDAGYSFPTAVAEVIDNSLEANANSIAVLLSEHVDSRGKRHIPRVAFVDDGDGMDISTLHHYPQIGFSTRYMRTDTIGKYGVGAKLAALNFCTRLDVWSRPDTDGAWLHAMLDLDNLDDDEAMIATPDEAPIPEDLAPFMPSKGTLVVWSNVDRLEEGRHAADPRQLRAELEKELARIFRYFLMGGIKVSVVDSTSGSATDLLAHDPLFLMEGTWADQVIGKHVKARVIADEQVPVAGSKARLRVTLYPKEVVRTRGKGGDEFAKKLRIPENEGSISFVRRDREINYTNVPRIFPRGVEVADRFIGIEVSFAPDLDDYFGVRNVKRGVEPHSDLRDKIRKLLERHVKEARQELDDLWGAAAAEEQEHGGEHSSVVEAAADANRTLPKSRAKGPSDEQERQQALNDLAGDVLGPKASRKDRDEYINRVRELPFVVESVDFPGNMFIDVRHLGNQVIIRLNTRHRFYREMWEPIKSIAERDAGTVTGEEAVRTARRTVEALTVLLIAYGKAESMDENPMDHYMDLRGYWGQFLDSLLGKVRNVK
jgi:hypothetical protein